MSDDDFPGPRRPIVILGAARSGTTLLADTLARHPDVAYWSEPQSVWRHGNAYRRGDVLFAEHATPRVREFIRGRFEDYRVRAGRARFMEKTPSNCLRMPFVLAVLPDAQVVHVLRDGRDVAMSAVREWKGTGIPRREDGQRISMGPLTKLKTVAREHGRLGERAGDLTGLLELPAYLPRLANILRRYLVPGGEATWGPRFPGLRQVRKTFSLLETCAMQWDASWKMARSACLTLPEDRCFEIRYEDLTSSPRRSFQNILDFLGLSRDPALLDHAESIIEPQVARWKTTMDPAVERRLESILGDSFRALGYPTTTSARADDRT